MDSQQQAEQILQETGVLLNGHFILTSGKHSAQYMQCARILQYPAHTETLIKGLADAFHGDNIDVVIGPAMGGVIIAYELARQLGAKNLFAEREDGKMTLRRSFAVEKGQRVLVAEDVITTGGSVREVMDVVCEGGGVVAGVAILVDRSMGQADFGVKTKAAYTADIVAYDAADCPLCKAGGLPAVKPGSRTL